MTATPDRTGLSLKDAGLFIKPHEKKWWKSAVVYQIYPASYKDSNGVSLGPLVMRGVWIVKLTNVCDDRTVSVTCQVSLASWIT